MYKAQPATFVSDDSSSAMAPSPMSTEEKTLAMKKEERDSLLAKQSNTPITPRVGPTKEAAAATQPPVGGPLRQEENVYGAKGTTRTPRNKNNSN